MELNEIHIGREVEVIPSAVGKLDSNRQPLPRGKCRIDYIVKSRKECTLRQGERWWYRVSIKDIMPWRDPRTERLEMCKKSLEYSTLITFTEKKVEQIIRDHISGHLQVHPGDIIDVFWVLDGPKRMVEIKVR